MNNNINNLQQWWENTYRHHQSKHHYNHQHLNHNLNQILHANNNVTNNLLNNFTPTTTAVSQLRQKFYAAGAVAGTGTESDVAGYNDERGFISAAALELTAQLHQHVSGGHEHVNFGRQFDADNEASSFSEFSNTLNGNYTFSYPYDDISEENAIPSMTLLFMAISYGLVVFGGVLGNATLVLTLCSASSVRLRNPLLLAVCIADLLVTGISAPVTLLNLAMSRKTKSLPLLVCKIIHYVQIMPVAASTLSFFMLSLDRYATVKHPRLAQLRQRRYLHVTLALLSWIASAVISTPFLFAYKIIAKTIIIKESGGNISITESSSTALSNTTITNATPPISVENSSSPELTSPTVSISCTAELGANAIFVSFIIFHTIAVFIIPGFGVLLNHYGVRRKLCALSLTARAAHGELPLPMPILRRQTHMVIVTGIANAQQAAGCGASDDSSNDNGSDDIAGDIQLHTLNPNVHRNPNANAKTVITSADTRDGTGGNGEGGNGGGASGSTAAAAVPLLPGHNVIKSCNPISPRAMREIRAHSQRQRISNNNLGSAAQHGPATPGIPLPQTSTLRSRRRLANMLIASAFIFIACWTPHVFCIFYKNFGYKEYCTKTSTYFNLLLGYMYSAISPVIYWALNHNTLRQSPCAPIIRLRSMQNFLRTRFRSNTVPPPPSSTNEAALGAFNPKLIKLTPKQYRAQASSHYLY